MIKKIKYLLPFAMVLALTSCLSSPSATLTTTSSSKETTTSTTTTSTTSLGKIITEWAKEDIALFQSILKIDTIPLPYIYDDYFSTSYTDETTKERVIWISDNKVGNIIESYGQTLTLANYTLIEGSSTYITKNSNQDIINIQLSYGAFLEPDSFDMLLWLEKGIPSKPNFPTEEINTYLEDIPNIVPPYQASIYYYETLIDEVNSKPYLRIHSIYPTQLDNAKLIEKDYEEKLLTTNWILDYSNYANVGIKAIDKDDTITLWFYEDPINNLFALSIEKHDPKIPTGEGFSIFPSSFPANYPKDETFITISTFVFGFINIHSANGIQIKSFAKGHSHLYNKVPLAKPIKSITFIGIPQVENKEYQGEITVFTANSLNEPEKEIKGNQGINQTFLLNGATYFYISNQKRVAFNCAEIKIIYM
ncbi:MAG: hypothetical protein RSA18_03350 [Bacilli bacterium]